MICPACGANLADDLKFCTQCGTALEAAPVVEEPIVEAPVVEAPVVEEPVAEVVCDACAFEPEAVEEPAFDAEIAPEAFDQIPEEPVEPEKPADKKPMIFGIIAVVAGALSLIGSCCNFWCISIPLSIVAIVMGILGIVFSKKDNNKTALILSIVGLALPVLGIILGVIMYFALFAFSAGSSLLGAAADSYYY